MEIPNVLNGFLKWRIRHISNRQFILILSVFIGLGGGLAAIVVKNTVFFIQYLLTLGFTKNYENYLYFFYPAAGIFLTVLFVRFINMRHIGHGIPSILYAISKNNGIIRSHNIYSYIITSALTVGFGGSAGLEGPTVAAGAAIGSNAGRVLHLNPKQIILLIGCACTGAMAALFKSPIAAIVFTLEVIMLDLTMSSLIPLLIASVTATLTAYAIVGKNVLLPFEITEELVLRDIPFYIFFGIIAGFISLYFFKIFNYIQKKFDTIKRWRYRLLLGGIALGILVFFFPALYGEGYQSINSCLHTDYNYLFENSLFYPFLNNQYAILLLILSLVFLKVIATSMTFGSGGIGGLFAPTLFVGANLGLFFATLFNSFRFHHIPESHFVLVGMAGLISGVLHAPLTGIFLIAEITNGYELFIPLMIVSTCSYATIRIFESNSLYTVQLAKRGELLAHDKDKTVLSMIKMDKLIETNFKTIGPDKTLGDLVEIISKSNRNIIPVLDDDQVLQGIVFLDHIRHIMFKQEMYDKIYVRDLMFMPTQFVETEDSMEVVMQKFQDSGKYNLPVIKDGKYIGFLSRSNVFSSYRRVVKSFSDE